jgi:hypothetical protein
MVPFIDHASQNFNQTGNLCENEWLAPPQLLVHSFTAPQSNLNISQIEPTIVAFWTDSKCDLRA